jgi:prepilin-type N-terminal cleavage/methylation domain-containing protein/prepilin-type processing-associated H-X9-DG protein
MRCPIAAFTLIELLVVVSIIAVLAGMLLPAIATVRDMAVQTKCASNLRQQGMAFMTYAQEGEGLLPMPLRINPSALGWNTNLSIEYGTGKQSVSASDTDRTSGDGVFVEPAFKRPANRGIASYRYYTGYGMNAFLPPSRLSPLTPQGIAQETNPTLSAIAQSALTPLVADTTNASGNYYGGWGLDRLSTQWHFQTMVGYPHRSRANLLYVDGRVEAQSVSQAYNLFTTTSAYSPGLSW